MRNRILIDFLWILVLYGIYGAVIYLAAMPQNDLAAAFQVFPPIVDDQPMSVEDFYLQVEFQALLSLAISLIATLGWYVIGQWGPKPHTTKSATWKLIWLLGLVFVIAGAVAAFWSAPPPSESPEVLAIFLLVSAVLFYYLATVLFSPVNVKFIVPGAKLLRRW